jgi:thiol-disulfide isomerase/thioredoxin
MSFHPESGTWIRAGRAKRRVPGMLGALGLAIGMATAFPLHAQVKAGDPFPELAAAGVVNLAGGELPTLAGKVALVDFWASWCAPCKAAFPALAKLHQEYAARGLVIAAVSVDEKPAAANAFWKKMAPPFPTLHDREQKLVKQVQVPVMPTTYLLGRDGRVRIVQQGFHGATTEKELRRQIEALLAEK